MWMDGGRLAVTFGEGSDEETVRVGSDLNDGQQHGLMISRENRNITIRVDTIKIEKYLKHNYQGKAKTGMMFKLQMDNITFDVKRSLFIQF